MKRIELKLKEHKCCSCTFTINGQHAYSGEFGHSVDMNPELAPDYGCGNSQFVPDPIDQNVKAKYKIMDCEYKQIQEWLSYVLATGACAYCK